MWNTTAKMLQEKCKKCQKKRVTTATRKKKEKSSCALRGGDIIKMAKLWNLDESECLQKRFFIPCLLSCFGQVKVYVHSGRIVYNSIFGKIAQAGAKKSSDSTWLMRNIYETVCPIKLFNKLLEKETKM